MNQKKLKFWCMLWPTFFKINCLKTQFLDLFQGQSKSAQNCFAQGRAGVLHTLRSAAHRCRPRCGISCWTRRSLCGGFGWPELCPPLTHLPPLLRRHCTVSSCCCPPHPHEYSFCRLYFIWSHLLPSTCFLCMALITPARIFRWHISRCRVYSKCFLFVHFF